MSIKLADIVDNSRTDKNTDHSYLGLYQELLHKKQHTAKNVLEIGIGPGWPKNGGSIIMWLDYFKNANVYALDIINESFVHDDIKNNERTKLFVSTNAYDELFFNETFLNPGLKFDFMLDDGPHTLESMKTFIRLYSQVMKDDGILAIEDVQSMDWIEDLKNAVPDELKPFIKVYDLRYIKNRYDDIVFTIDKSENANVNDLTSDNYIENINVIEEVAADSVEDVAPDSVEAVAADSVEDVDPESVEDVAPESVDV